MNGKQKDHLNYHVAFLASVVGLAAFREDLSAFTFQLFGFELTAFRVLVPTVVLLFIGSYVNALTMTVVDGLSVTRFPLRGILLRLATFCNLTALLFPLGVGLMWLLTEVLGLANDTPLTSFGLALASASGIVQLSFIYKMTRTMQRQNAYRNALREIQEVHKRNEPPADADLGFLQRYEYLVESAEKYLQLKGYGTKTTDLGKLAAVLRDKSAFRDADVRTARAITKARNQLVHDKHAPRSSERKKLDKYVEDLYQKLKIEYLELLEDSSPAKSERPGHQWRATLLSLMTVLAGGAALFGALATYNNTAAPPDASAPVALSSPREETPEEKVRDAINQARAMAGVPPLLMNPHLLDPLLRQCQQIVATHSLEPPVLKSTPENPIGYIAVTPASEDPEAVLAAIQADPVKQAWLLNPAFGGTAETFCEAKLSPEAPEPQLIFLQYLSK